MKQWPRHGMFASFWGVVGGAVFVSGAPRDATVFDSGAESKVTFVPRANLPPANERERGGVPILAPPLQLASFTLRAL